MTDSELLLFEGHSGALPIYEKLKKEILDVYPDVRIKVQKTQISFSRKYLFACVSFTKVRKAKERPKNWLVVTFGLGHQEESPRIDVATEPYPNRWTHHVLISETDEIDDELMAWIREAGEFAERK